MKTIIFRANVGNVVGTGHLIEIVTIHKYLKKKYNFLSVLVVNNHHGYLRLITEASFDRIEYLESDEFNNIENEFTLLKKIKNKYDTDNIILNLFDRAYDYYSKINKLFSKNIVILDTQKIDKYDVDNVINFSIFQNKTDYIENPYRTKYYTGPNYFILSEKIKDFSKCTAKKEVGNIFINQGGSDPFGITCKILEFLLSAKDKFHRFNFHIIIGGALKKRNMNQLKKVRKKLSDNFIFYNNIPIEKMFEIMSICDLAITAAGNTLYELAYLGIPVIIIGHHKRHDAVANIFQQKKCALNLGIGTFLEKEDFLNSFQILVGDYSLRKNYSENSKKLIDGKGLERVTRIIKREFDLK